MQKKILLADLLPNPFRDLTRNPLDREKIEALKESISQTTFWDTLEARPHPKESGKYQLAFGHHRVAAAQELGLETANVSIYPFTDAVMLQKMANENSPSWKTPPAVINETVWAAKQFLDDLLDGYESLEEMKLDGLDLGHLDSFLEASDERAFSRLRNDGVGRRPLERFLGDKNWHNHLEGAMEALKYDSAKVHAERLRKREERARLKAEEEKRKAAEAAEAERKQAEELARVQAEQERLKAEKAIEDARLAAIKAEEEAKRAEIEKARAEEKAKKREEFERLKQERLALQKKQQEEKAARDAEKKRLQEEEAAAKKEEARLKAERKAADKLEKAAAKKSEEETKRLQEHEELLQQLDRDGIDRAAFEMFSNRNQAMLFTSALKGLSVSIPRERQVEAASMVIEQMQPGGYITVRPSVVSTYAGYLESIVVYELGLKKQTIKVEEEKKEITFDSKAQEVLNGTCQAMRSLRKIFTEFDSHFGKDAKVNGMYDLKDCFEDGGLKYQFYNALSSFAELVAHVKIDESQLAKTTKNTTTFKEVVNG